MGLLVCFGWVDGVPLGLVFSWCWILLIGFCVELVIDFV